MGGGWRVGYTKPMILLLVFIPLIAFGEKFVFFEGSSYEGFIRKAEKARVVYLGEIHDRRDVHNFQIKVIRDLHDRGHRLVILMEAFQQQFQEYIDLYLDGEMEEEEFLERTEYHKRWRFDKTLYAPIWRFARENGVKLFALNVPSELLREVRKKGLADVKSRYLPARIMPFRRRHKEFLLEAMGEHRDKVKGTFFDVQLAWDMGMAYKVAKTAIAFPEYVVVVIVGSGHVWRGYGIPERVNFLIGELPQLVSYIDGDEIYFLFSRDFSRDRSSANSIRDPN